MRQKLAVVSISVLLAVATPLVFLASPASAQEQQDEQQQEDGLSQVAFYCVEGVDDCFATSCAGPIEALSESLQQAVVGNGVTVGSVVQFRFMLAILPSAPLDSLTGGQWRSIYNDAWCSKAETPGVPLSDLLTDLFPW